MNYKLQIKSVSSQASLIKLVVAVFIIYNFIICDSVFAATASSSAKPSPEATSSASLLDKINQIKEKAASKASELLSEVTKKLQNKAYFGTISSVDGDNVTLSYAGADKKISTTEFTSFASTIKTTKKIATLALKDFSDGDFIAALGDADDKGVLKAKKIIKSSPMATDSSRLVWGVVQKISGGLITVRGADGSDQTITGSGQSDIFLGQEEASLLDIKTARTIIARGEPTKNAGLSASYIYVVPSSSSSKPEKTPLPSIAASPSASPKKK